MVGLNLLGLNLVGLVRGMQQCETCVHGLVTCGMPVSVGQFWL
jgi:hypothetical protein